MDGKIDEIREALIKLRDFAKSFGCDYQEECTPGDDDMCQSCKHVCIADGALADLAALSAIDPEAIRRGYEEKIAAVMVDIKTVAKAEMPSAKDVLARLVADTMPMDRYYELEASIIGADPAQDYEKPERANPSRLLECSVCGNLEGAPYEQGDSCTVCGVGVYRAAMVKRLIEEAKE